MAKHKRMLKQIPLTTGQTLDVELYYHLGGMNYFQGVTMKRGLYLSATPVRRSGLWTETTAFSGTCVCIHELKRFSQKALDTFTVSEEDQQKIIDHVLAKNNLTIVKETV